MSRTLDLADAKSMADGGAEYFSANASADAAHARKEDTAALISGFDLKCGDDLYQN